MTAAIVPKKATPNDKARETPWLMRVSSLKLNALAILSALIVGAFIIAISDIGRPWASWYGAHEARIRASSPTGSVIKSIRSRANVPGDAPTALVSRPALQRHTDSTSDHIRGRPSWRPPSGT